MDKSALYGDPFYEDEPFYRTGMSVQEFQREQKYLNDNIEAFVKGDYMPLWKQRKKKAEIRGDAIRKNHKETR